MKKLLLLILTLSVILTLAFPAAATEAGLPTVIDNAELLAEDEEAALAETISELMVTYGMDIVILTEPSLNGDSAQDYADSYYDTNGYADDGILFLLAMEEREWYFSTCGEAIYVFTDYGIDRMGSLVLPCLSEGEYCKAFSLWLDALPGYFESYLNSDPVDSPDYGHGQSDDRDNVVYYDHKEESSVNVLIAPLIGLIAAAITILIMRGQMNTARRQSGAAEYMNQDSYHLKVRRDMFLYSHVSKTPKPKNNGTSGGGSSVHMGGGGRSHGGGGGRF